jgi:hypothetical protein
MSDDSENYDDDDSSSSEDDMDTIDEISQFEYSESPMDDDGYPNEDRIHEKYYIGCYSCAMDCYLDTNEGYSIKILEKTPKLFFTECIRAKTFFRFRFDDIVRFLEYCKNKYTIDRLPFEPNLRVHIMKLYIEPISIFQGFIVNQYLCVLKTHWISLIQRHWKRVCQERQTYVDYYRNPVHRMARELGGRGRGPKFSGLRGMLSCYSTK